MLTASTFYLLATLLLWAGPLHASKPEMQTVTATGFAEIRGSGDTGSARRRALADALLSAAQAGGSDVSGYTATSNGTVTGDFALVRTRFRIVKYVVTGEKKSGKTWRVSVRAVLAPPSATLCERRQMLPITAYAPRFQISPQSPAWSVPMAEQVFTGLLDALEAHQSVRLTRATNRNRSHSNSEGLGDDFSYAALTTGNVRTVKGDWAFEPEIIVGVAPKGFGKQLTLEIQVKLYRGAASHPSFTKSVQRTVPLPRASTNSVLTLTRPNRTKLVGELTEGLEASFAEALDALSCAPIKAKLKVSGSTVSIDVGSRHGLTPGDLAFTKDASGSTTVLEIAKLGKSRTVLRPLDRNLSLRSFAGRPIEFVQVK